MHGGSFFVFRLEPGIVLFLRFLCLCRVAFAFAAFAMLAFAKAFTIFAFAIFVFAKAFALDRSFAAAFFWHAIFAFAKAFTIFAFAIFVFARFAKDLGLHRSFADAFFRLCPDSLQWHLLRSHLSALHELPSSDCFTHCIHESATITNCLHAKIYVIGRQKGLTGLALIHVVSWM